MFNIGQFIIWLALSLYVIKDSKRNLILYTIGCAIGAVVSSLIGHTINVDMITSIMTWGCLVWAVFPIVEMFYNKSKAILKRINN